MIQNFFNNDLIGAGSRISATITSSRALLDKNEQTQDMDPAFKKRVLQRLMDANWNRYPDALPADVENAIAAYCGLASENVVVGPGSAGIITTLLNYFGLNNKKIVIAQPAYSLFEYHCKTYGIPFTPWTLDENLEYDVSTLPVPDHNTVMIITSPNNPVGSSIDPVILEKLLCNYPQTLVVLDAVYTEFSDTDLTPLVKRFENLLVLRSFSKAFPAAGIRLGYLCASVTTAPIIRKLMLQFSLNHFSLLFARELLRDETFIENSRKRVADIKQQREELRVRISAHPLSKHVHIFPSQGNFLLIRVHEAQYFQNLMDDLSEQGIKVLNTSGSVKMQRTFRVSVGSEQENSRFLEILFDSLESNRISGSLMAGSTILGGISCN